MSCAAVAALFSAALAVAAPARGSVVVSCPFSAFTGGDLVNRGFYVAGYSGFNLHTVKLRYLTNQTPGVYKIALTARLNAYNGLDLGTQHAAFGPEGGIVTYNFGGVPVTPGATVTFTHTVEEVPVDGVVAFDIGTGPCLGVTETEGTTPPLDTFRRNGMAVEVTQLDPGPCTPGPVTLCVDDQPGDRRFRLELPFHTVQAGGKHGQGGALSTAPVGVSRGGLFWFSNAGNPEVLAKVLNGCGINQRYWVFASAGTNQGYSLHVQDTVNGERKSYHNADLHPATPIQDTGALPCE